MDFALEVTNHINNYVVPQYGDFPDEHIEGMSLEEIKGKLSSYVQRIGKAHVNGGMERAITDMHKIAHFACYAANKLNEDM